MSQPSDPFFVGGTQIILGTLGASVFPTKITPPAGCVGMQFKLMGAAGSTVQIIANQITTGTVSGATSITGLGGYPLITGEMYPFYGPASFYLACTGASATIAANFMFSAAGTTLA